LLRLQTPSRAAASNFTHPRRLRTLSPLQPSLSFILISVSYSTTYRSLEDRLFQPILDCLVIRLVLPLPALSPKTTSPAPAFAHVHTTTTITTCGSPSFVFCFF
jgi:hypothetical protein